MHSNIDSLSTYSLMQISKYKARELPKEKYKARTSLPYERQIYRLISPIIRDKFIYSKFLFVKIFFFFLIIQQWNNYRDLWNRVIFYKNCSLNLEHLSRYKEKRKILFDLWYGCTRFCGFWHHQQSESTTRFLQVSQPKLTKHMGATKP